MSKFFLTFMQYHPLRDNYIVILAENKERAREAAFYCFKDKWSGLYPEGGFSHNYYCGGQAGRSLNAVDVLDELDEEEITDDNPM